MREDKADRLIFRAHALTEQLFYTGREIVCCLCTSTVRVWDYWRQQQSLCETTAASLHVASVFPFTFIPSRLVVYSCCCSTHTVSWIDCKGSDECRTSTVMTFVFYFASVSLFLCWNGGSKGKIISYTAVSEIRTKHSWRHTVAEISSVTLISNPSPKMFLLNGE